MSRVSLANDRDSWRRVAERLEVENAKLREALEALRLQALQSNVNSAANEWGLEAIAMANAALSNSERTDG